MKLLDLIQELDGAGLVITDPQEIEAEMAAIGCGSLVAIDKAIIKQVYSLWKSHFPNDITLDPLAELAE